jgi:aminoglycoside 6'-N-acetyltransferase
VHIPAHLPTLTHGPLTLRAAREPDIPALEAMLQEPEVRRWWATDVDVRADLAEQPCWTILHDDQVIGWLQVDEERAEDWRYVAFDIALNAAGRGHGHGRQALRMAIAHFTERGHHRFTIDPAADNARAIRAYESVGFRRVGVLREADRLADGRWGDLLLMDLLARELGDA